MPVEPEVQSTYLIRKLLGETPLEALLRVRAHFKIDDAVPMTYAGRLDPAAEGVLVILAGEECKNKLAYTNLSKTYVAEIVLGVSTDSYDLLGMPVAHKDFEMTVATTGELFTKAEAWIKAQLGTTTQQYPPYSSKTVCGKQLHEHAKEGSAVQLPTHQVTLHAYGDIGMRPKKRADILARVGLLTEKVTGDFRQKEILAAWTKLAETLPSELPVLKVTLEVGSGFYIRQLAEDLGKYLGTGACLYSLNRTKVGQYTT